MADKGFEQLNIDAAFKNLIRPLRRDEYHQLELNLSIDGCRDPIITWDGTIVDGHNRYEICNRLRIPYMTQEIEFDSREAAVAWICSNQLGRRNITEETRKYLIGKQYEAEKIIASKKNLNGANQYTAGLESAEGVSADIHTRGSRGSGRRTAGRIGKEHHVSPTTVIKYAKYSEALDTIAQKAPELLPQILSGNYKVSYNNLVALSMMDTNEIQELGKKVAQSPLAFIRYSESRKNITGETPAKLPGPVPETPAIKTMPAYDPDAEVAGLTLTIPSWMSSIERTKKTADLNVISPSAKDKLEEALEALQNKVQEMLTVIKGE